MCVCLMEWLPLSPPFCLYSHNTGTTHWLDPRFARYQKHSILECSENGKCWVLGLREGRGGGGGGGWSVVDLTLVSPSQRVCRIRFHSMLGD